MSSECRIKEAREYADMSQKELAKALGITQQAIYYYESGERDIKASTLVKMADALGVSVCFLLGITNIPCPTADNAQNLSQRESELISHFRKMEPVQQSTLMTTARTFAYATKQKRERDS